MRQIFSTRDSGDGDGIRGRVKHKELPLDYRQALDDYSGHSTATGVVPTFPRYKLGTVVYQVWNKSRTRNSSVCKFKNTSGSVQFGSIRCICFCRGDPVAVLAVFTPKHNALEDVRNSSIPELNVYPCRSTPSLSK